MKKYVFYTIAFLILPFTISCAKPDNGGVVTEKRPVAPFTKINVSGNVEIQYTQSNSPGLEVQADAKDLEKIKTIVKDGTLVITKEGSAVRHDKHKKTIIRISSPLIEEITLSKAAHFETDSLSGESLKLIASDGVDIHISRLHTENKCVMIFSAGVDCEVGKLISRDLNLECMKATDVALRQLLTQNIILTTAGGADVLLQGETDHITIKSGGGSDINIQNLNYKEIIDNRYKR